MKTVYAILMAFFLCLGGGMGAYAYNVQAPNSFDDADRGSWEYRAVETMCAEGKSPKYDASYFKENPHISRYELAGVIIDLLDHGRNLSDEDEESLQKMTKSYSRELAARDWHAPEAEKKQPLLEIHGDLRLRHTKGEGDDARARLGFQYNVSDNTTLSAGGKAEVNG